MLLGNARSHKARGDSNSTREKNTSLGDSPCGICALDGPLWGSMGQVVRSRGIANLFLVVVSLSLPTERASDWVQASIWGRNLLGWDFSSSSCDEDSYNDGVEADYTSRDFVERFNL